MNLKNGPIINTQAVSTESPWEKMLPGVTFLTLLDGRADVEMPGITCKMQPLDVILAEDSQHFTVIPREQSIMAVITMKAEFFAQCGTGQYGHFVCNSTLDRERNYAPLRTILAQIFLRCREQHDPQALEIYALSYALLHHMNQYHYTKTQNPDKYQQRQDIIMNYLHQHYAEDLTLEKLAREVFVTPTYLSRFFKQRLGINFLTCLNDIRLSHAAADLTSLTASLTTICYNNGFASYAAFSRLFRQRYGMQPAEYRQQKLEQAEHAARTQAQANITDENTSSRVISSLRTIAGENDASALPQSILNRITIQVRDIRNAQAITPLWKSMINLGYATQLHNFDLQGHLTLAQKEIGFHYGRIQSVLSNSFIPYVRENNSYNFSDFDRTIESLLENRLIPYLDLSQKIEYMITGEAKVVYMNGADESTRQETDTVNRQYIHKIDALLRHCMNTFGAVEVSRWCFEVCYFHDEKLQVAESPVAFVRRFEHTCSQIKAFLPGAMVGGVHHNCSIGNEYFRQILQEMDRIDFQPDFISLCLFPYQAQKDNQSHFTYSPDPDYALHQVEEIRQLMGTYPRLTVQLHAAVLGTDVRPRNMANDSCFQATFLARNTISLLGLVDVLGYWQLSDIAVESTDSRRLLFGGTGIVNSKGLKKPGFTVLKRMGYQQPLLASKSENCLITTNAINAHHILLCNYSHYSSMFCLQAGEISMPANVYDIFDEAKPQEYIFELDGLSPGRYKITQSILNRENGSLLDAWIGFGGMDELQRRDIQYFRDIIHPRRLAEFKQASHSRLVLKVQLQPHEVRFIEITKEM